jgi:hypothetical protein
MAMDVWNGGYALFAATTTDGNVFYSEEEGEHWQTIIKGIGQMSKVTSLSPPRAWGRRSAALIGDNK